MPTPLAPHSLDTEAFHQWVAARHSVRAFLPRTVDPETLSQILSTARLAPSSSNLQPGRFLVLGGERRQQLSDALVQAVRGERPEAVAQSYYPEPLPMALKKRQVGAAQAVYKALGIDRKDLAGRAAHVERNFRFFDAPVAMLVTIDAQLWHASHMDLGMMVYGAMMAAHAQGLASCAIGALATYPELIQQALNLDPNERVVCGLAMGYEDTQAPINQARTTRSAVQEYVTYLD